NFCEALGRPDLTRQGMQTDDFQRSPSAAQRAAKGEIEAIMRTRTLAEWVAFFAATDVCVGEVNGLAEAVNDPQLRHRDMILPAGDPRQPDATQPGIAIKLTATPGSIRSRPPLPGEHTDQVLRELGRAPAEIAALRAAGAV
ncbi:MAG: CoA transferase, partial [Porticoccaceae bacterium]